MPCLCLYHEALKSLYTHMHMYKHIYTGMTWWRPVSILWLLLLSLWVHMFYSFILQEFVLLGSIVSSVSPSSFCPVLQGSPNSEGRGLMEISSLELCVRGSLFLCKIYRLRTMLTGNSDSSPFFAGWDSVVITLPSLIFHQYLSEFSTHMSNISSCLSTNTLAQFPKQYL